ncbi:hypothetical protein [Advenella alkanexedens]|uniref:P-type ATPase n=1 Tax=Advenella alkanexedens TaxID=1481665 RepID=UPI00267689E7|nr:hypothetical protein [Advenella alkanexedens]WKU18707.1 hypothetical protein Q3V95_10420 [Advenella alkanexedens]
MKAVSIFSIPKNLPDHERQKRRHMLASLGIAWLVMMQVMMFAFPGYFRGDYIGTESLAMLDTAIIIMNWLSFALTMPVLLYCAWPIWQGVFRKSSTHSMRVNMDWPVALGILTAFIPSVIATVHQQGEVYFESVSMFVAFLLTARYLEFCAEQSARFSEGGVPAKLERERGIMTAKADKIAFVFVIAQIFLAIVSGIVWYLFIDRAHALPVLVALFVMSCPCALSMAVPTASSAARAIFLNNHSFSPEQQEFVLHLTRKTANQNLYGSLAWHILMAPLAMFGLVAPWVAAITMLVSSLAVAWNSWRLYKKFHIQGVIINPDWAAGKAVQG